jgi:hypothetical protein
MITKTVQRSDDLYIQFTNEELQSLGIKPGDKFSYKVDKDGLLLQKFATLEVDISEWSRDILEMLIVQSVEQDISVNEVISNILTKQLAELDV